jgi:DNA-3-methyladenine glycosylase II
VEAYKKALAKDAKVKQLFKAEIEIPKGSTNITMSLINSILGQQLSVQVARVMKKRFIELLGKKNPSAKDILIIPVEKIKAIGISQRKAEYIHAVAEFMATHKITKQKLAQMSDDEIIDLLTQIKGVGRWTVEMILIFSLKREDVFAVDDLGIQQGMIKLFKLQELPKNELLQKMKKLSERWSPYRSYICLHMWRWKDL